MIRRLAAADAVAVGQANAVDACRNFDPELGEQALYCSQRQAHDACVASVQPRDGRKGRVLDCVGPGFVEGVARGHIGVNFCVRIRTHDDGR